MSSPSIMRNLLLLAAGALSIKVARISVDQRVVQRVTNDRACRLHDYMRLPASQYVSIPLPMGATLARVCNEEDLFTLSVPPLRFAIPRLPAVEVRPIVLARVCTLPDRVLITSESCRITGSPLVDSLQLNDRFNFSVRTCLTWQQDGLSYNCPGEAAIHSHTAILVDVQPPGPFAIIPRKVLEAVGTSAMELALRSLQATFVSNLGADYEKWASDENHRAMRAQTERG